MFGQNLFSNKPRRSFDLRTRLSLLAPQISVDAIGGENVTFATVATLWGALLPFNGKQQFEGLQFQEAVSTLIVTRWRTDIAGGMRLVPTAQNGAMQTFLVHAVFDPDMKHRFVYCLCEDLKP